MSRGDYHEEKGAAVRVGHALERRGWKLFGWKQDKSDSMTDYWDPESWDGVAQKGDFVACVNVSPYIAKSRSGRPETTMVPVPGGICPRCSGAKVDPLGWTLVEAQQNPALFNTDSLRAEHLDAQERSEVASASIALPGGGEIRWLLPVVSPLQFNDAGLMKCRRCHGIGHGWKEPREEVLFTWPTFQANPRGRTWHVERGGAIEIPLKLETGILGNLVLLPDSGGTRFSESEVAYATALGDLVTAALGRVLVIEREQRARGEAEEAVRYRDQMLRVVSHDLRNPLHTIGMVANLLSAPSIRDEDRAHHLQIVTRTVERMNRLIHDLLDAARVQSGHALAVRPAPVVTRELLAEMDEQLGPQAQDKNIRLEINADSAPAAMFADRDRLLQVFSNLIGNAIKFTGEGGRITVSATSEGDDDVCFSVSDTGSGIPEENLPHLFEPFWQARDRATLGTGLGLSIARGIVEAHGGEISVESAPGVGTTFSFTIPRAGPPDSM